jgi:hypothetical protein
VRVQEGGRQRVSECGGGGRGEYTKAADEAQGSLVCLVIISMFCCIS